MLPRRCAAFFVEGELYPRVGKMRAMDQEGKGAIKWTRLSCRDVRRERRPSPASCAGLQSRQFPAHFGDAGADQGLVSDESEGEAHQDRTKVVSHGRYVAFQMAEVAIPRNLFADILRMIAELRSPPVTSTA